MFVTSHSLMRRTPFVFVLTALLALTFACSVRADTEGVSSYIITSTSGPHGTISDEGVNSYPAGSTVTFHMNPSFNYHVDDVVVDLVSIGPALQYSFPDLSADHTISVTFAIDTHTITASAGLNGSIDPTGPVQVAHGSDRSFSIDPDPGYHRADVIVDGNSVGPVASYTFNNVITNHTISASFAANGFTITASASPGGGISPSGSVPVAFHDDQSFDITPDAHYHIDDVVVDGSSRGPLTSYEFLSVSENHTIEAGFAIDQHTLTVNTAGNGTVQKSPNQASYDYNSSVQLTANAASGWTFSGWSGDASGSDNPLTVTMDQNRIITATFTQNAATGAITINDLSQFEGNSNTTQWQFTVQISPTVNHSVTLSFATASITATSGEDFYSSSGNLTIPANTSSVPVFVTVKGDTKYESDETFKVRLSNAQGATIQDDTGIGTIRNDDAPPATPSITIGDVSTLEGNSGYHYLVFTVSLSTATTQSVRVSYASRGVTALVSDNDYIGVSGTLTIPAGSTSRTISVAVYGDSKVESDETFQINLSNPVGATIADPQAIGTIQNDDAAVTMPVISINDVSKNEGNSGTTPFTFTVSLSFTTSSTVTVRYATSGVTAKVSDFDYDGRSGTLTIPANTSSATITVSVKGDRKVESNEKFVINLSSPTNATIGDPQGVGTILNDDGSAIVSNPVEAGQEPLYAGVDDEMDALAAEATIRPALQLESNPVRGDLKLSFAMPAAGEARVTVVDLQGRLVREVASGSFDAGRHDVRLAGSALPSGIYFARLETATGSVVQRFTTLR